MFTAHDTVMSSSKELLSASQTSFQKVSKLLSQTYLRVEQSEELIAECDGFLRRLSYSYLGARVGGMVHTPAESESEGSTGSPA